MLAAAAGEHPSDRAGSPRPSGRGRTLLLATVLVVAVALRCLHLDVGLPATPDVDAFKFVDAALAMSASGDWSPRGYQYPGLYPGLLALLYRAFAVDTPYVAHLVARLVAALAGVATVAFTWVAARRAAGERDDGGGYAPALAGALVAVSIVAVTASRTAAADSLLAAAAVATLVAVTGRRATAWWRSAVATGTALGLAVAAKLTGLYLVPLAALPAARRLRAGRGRALATVGLTYGIAAAIFVAATPWVVPRWERYLTTFLREVTAVQRHGQIGRVQGGWLDYLVSTTPTWEAPWLGTSILGTAGAATLVVGLAATAVALTGRWGWRAAVHAVFFVVYLALVSGPGRLKAVRFLLPVLPSFFLLAALGLERAVAILRGRLGSPLGSRLLAAVAVAAMLSPPLLVSGGLVWRAGRATTQEVAAEWAARHLPDDAGVFLAPLFVNHLASAVARPLSLPGVGPRQYRVPGMPAANAELAPIYTPELLAELRRAGAGYVVSASYFDDAFRPVAENRRFFPRSVAAYAAWRDALERQGERLIRIEGWEDGRLGPDIEVWRLR